MSDVRIMVVEDERIVARDIRNRLERFGYLVVATASSGGEAARKAGEAGPDLVLMDIMLKGEMDGIEAAELIRARFNIPVVYLTAYADDHTLQRAKVTGPFGYILKPFEERELQTTVEMALYKHRTEEALRKANEALEARVEERTANLKEANAQLRREVEERKRAEAALRESQAQLLQAQKMEAVGRLAGGIAHDFNNQLSVILGYVDLVLEDVTKGSALAHNLQQILEAARRSADLTKQLLLFSNIQPADRQPVDVNGRVEALQKMLGRLLGEHIVVALDLDPGLWPVKADPVNLDQVVTNLAVNGRDAMPEGGTLRIETACVEVDEAYCRRHLEARPGRFVRLAVSDTGVGMDREVMEHLFEPFFTTKGPEEGTGLGLSVVYGIVQSHDGWITVESRPAGGSRFEVFLPALDEEERAVEASLPHEADALRGSGERILVVEDEPQLREALARILVEKGYRVRACGTLARARAAAASGRFDLVLCDVALPDGKGPDLALEMLTTHADMPVLLMTGYPDRQQEWARIQDAGLKLLLKPLSVNELMAQVRSALAGRPD